MIVSVWGGLNVYGKRCLLVFSWIFCFVLWVGFGEGDKVVVIGLFIEKLSGELFKCELWLWYCIIYKE